MRNTNRFLILGGGHVAALTLLLLSACGPGGDKRDSGQSPDAGPPTDGTVDMPDAGLPPDGGGEDLGTTPDLGVDEGTPACTDEMRLNRVSPPCDPDTNTGAGHGPTAMDGLTGFETWWCGSGYIDTNMGVDAMGRVWLGMPCVEYGPVTTAPFVGTFYYDLDGKWYFNWKNRNQQMSARLSFHTGDPSATIELFNAGESIPYKTVYISPR